MSDSMPPVDEQEDDPLLDDTLPEPALDPDTGRPPVRFEEEEVPDADRRGESPFDRQSESIAAAREGRVRHEARVEQDESIDAVVEAFVRQDKGGFVEIERDGPADIPQAELGVIETLPVGKLRGKSISDVIRGRHGGGAFTLRFRRADKSFANVPDAYLAISGDWIPHTRAGKAAKRAEAREQDDLGGGQTAMQMLLEMQEKHAAALLELQEKSEKRMQELRAEMKAAAESSTKEVAAVASANARIREAEIRARLELDRAREESERQTRLKTMEMQSAAALAEIRAKSERESREHEQRMAEERAERIAERKREADERKRERQSMGRLERFQIRSQEMQATGGLGFKGQQKLLTHQGQAVADLLTKKLKDQAGITDDEEGEGGGFDGILGKLVDTFAPVLANAIGPAIANKFGGAPQATPRPMPQMAPMQMPTGSTDVSGSLPAPSVQQLPPPTAPAAPGQDAPAAPAAPAASGPAPGPDPQYEVRTAAQFVAGLTMLARNQPQPDIAWEQMLAEPNISLDLLYGQMTPRLREAFAADPAGFFAGCEPAIPQQVAAWHQMIRTDPKASQWFADLCACGPWVEDDGDDETV